VKKSSILGKDEGELLRILFHKELPIIIANEGELPRE
jgi:hypothetical protein